MPVNFGVGFNITAKESIDTRFVLTKEEMRSERYASTGGTIAIPSHYACLCSDDNLIYVYDENNEISDETGKYRAYKGISDFSDTQIEIDGELYEYLKYKGFKIQVDSAINDGLGRNIADSLDSKQPLITDDTKISSDLVDDSASTTHKFVTVEQIAEWNNKQDALPEGQPGTFLKLSSTNTLEWVSLPVDSELSLDSSNPVENKVVTAALNTKQDALPSGSNATFLHRNRSTGQLEWIPQNQISVNEPEELLIFTLTE